MKIAATTVSLLALHLLLAAAAAGQAASPGAGEPAVDPFYQALLYEGIQAFNEGDAPGAARSLRLACFGMLDAPVALGGCLTRLGLAQAEAGDRDGLAETFRRLVEVEQRFRGYSTSSASAAVRARLEGYLVRWIPEQQLEAVGVFSHLADRRTAIKLQRLPPQEQRREIARLLAAEPENPQWHLEQGRLAMADGDPQAAIREAETALRLAPGEEEALCLRGLARSRTEACATAVADLEGCAWSRQEEAFAAARLECYIELERWREADALVAALPAPLKAQRRLEKLARQVERKRPAASPAGAREAEGAGSGGRVPPTTEPRPLLPAGEEAKLQRARRMMASIRDAGDLTAPLALAREVADAYPQATEAQHLVAEIAYRASRWQEAVHYFRRGGDPGEGRPVLLFYLAVSLYETGERQAASQALERCIEKIDKTPFVESYRAKILGTRGSS